MSAEDPRLSGTQTVALRFSGRGDGTSSVTGTARIANVAGTWSGEVTGDLGTGGRLSLTEVGLLGTGLFSGFRYDAAVTGGSTALALQGTVGPTP